MKFLCVSCDQQMSFSERQIPGDGTLAAVFDCPSCDRAVAMLTNPMETQLVSSLGVEIGGRRVPEQPMQATRTGIESGRDDAFADGGDGSGTAGGSPASPEADSGPGPGASTEPARVEWSDEAVERLGRVPSFVRGMVRRIYTDWAKDSGIRTITPEVMDRARSELGLEGM